MLLLLLSISNSSLHTFFIFFVLFILAVCMHECLRKHPCMSFTFAIAVLNGCFLSKAKSYLLWLNHSKQKVCFG